MFFTIKGELVNVNSIKKIRLDESSVVIEWQDNSLRTKLKCGSASHAQGEYNSFMEFLKKNNLIYNFNI